MPEKETLERAREDAREGKAPTTQAGEFVREEIHHVREGKHGVRSPKQAIAIGLSKARKAGVKLPPAPAGTPSAKKEGSSGRRRSSAKSSRSWVGQRSDSRLKIGIPLNAMSAIRNMPQSSFHSTSTSWSR